MPYLAQASNQNIYDLSRHDLIDLTCPKATWTTDKNII